MVHRFLYKYVSEGETGWKKDYADCIYTTILNDTDNFVNSNVDKETFKVVSELMELGLKPHVITNQFLYRKSIYYYRFIGAVLSTIEVIALRHDISCVIGHDSTTPCPSNLEGSCCQIALYHSTLKMLADNHQTIEAYSKMMRWTKGTYDVEIQVLFQEYEGSLYRVSLRSYIHDVAKIAQHFGGGGHVKASGFEIKGEYDLVKDKVIKYIESVIT
jgi:phosphoesterase RecJ-like protein